MEWPTQAQEFILVQLNTILQLKGFYWTLQNSKIGRKEFSAVSALHSPYPCPSFPAGQSWSILYVFLAKWPAWIKISTRFPLSRSYRPIYLWWYHQPNAAHQRSIYFSGLEPSPTWLSKHMKIALIWDREWSAAPLKIIEAQGEAAFSGGSRWKDRACWSHRESGFRGRAPWGKAGILAQG